MKIKCVSGPIFVDGAMMFTGQEREVQDQTALKMVAEHPFGLEIVAPRLRVAPPVALGTTDDAAAVLGIPNDAIEPAESIVPAHPDESIESAESGESEVTDVRKPVVSRHAPARRGAGKGQRS